MIEKIPGIVHILKENMIGIKVPDKNDGVAGKFIEKESGTGEVETLLVEVKPLKQTTKPKVRKRKTKSYINECITFEINAAKWKSAREYCEKNGWKFIIITEKDIFSSYK